MAGNLGPQFHGTFRDIDSRVVSANRAGVNKNFPHIMDSRTDRAYSTTRENIAWDMADITQRRFAEKHNVVPGRTRVYEVHPHPEQEMGEHHEGHRDFDPTGDNLAEYHAPHYDIKRSVDIRPGHQGTFPEINWNEYKAKPRASKANPATHADAINHPTDEHIATGHPGSQMNQEHLLALGRQWSTGKKSMTDMVAEQNAPKLFEMAPTRKQKAKANATEWATRGLG